VGVLGRGLVDPAIPVLHADDVGLTRGDGCFEGLRVVDGTIDNLDAHVARMRRSAAALDIDFDESAWRDLAAEAAAAWPVGIEASMRWFLTRGRPGPPATGIVTIAPISPEHLAERRSGVRVITLCRGTRYDAFADAPWLLGGVKTISYAINMAAGREAKRRGADDVIFVSTDDRVLEAPTASVVWTVGDTMHTTPLGPSGILGGTIQQRLFERAADNGWQIATTPALVDDLHAADALFLMSSARGPVDVIELDGQPRNRDLDLLASVQKLAGF
jgi:4-amino-4-deoxychorismate lyase